MTANTEPMDERIALQTILEVMDRVEPGSRERVLRTVMTFLNVNLNIQEPWRVVSQPVPRLPSTSTPDRNLTFGNTDSLSPKDFLHEKQPQTDIERVACLAYYLCHYRNTPHFKTVDISKLNTEAAQLKFSNSAYAVVNATNAGLLTSAGKGKKQISAIGERFVDALPDRDSARMTLRSSRPRRGRKTSTQKRRKSTDNP